MNMVEYQKRLEALKLKREKLNGILEQIRLKETPDINLSTEDLRAKRVQLYPEQVAGYESQEWPQVATPVGSIPYMNPLVKKEREKQFPMGRIPSREELIKKQFEESQAEAAPPGPPVPAFMREWEKKNVALPPTEEVGATRSFAAEPPPMIPEGESELVKPAWETPEAEVAWREASEKEVRREKYRNAMGALYPGKIRTTGLSRMNAIEANEALNELDKQYKSDVEFAKRHIQEYEPPSFEEWVGWESGTRGPEAAKREMGEPISEFKKGLAKYLSEPTIFKALGDILSPSNPEELFKQEYEATKYNIEIERRYKELKKKQAADPAYVPDLNTAEGWGEMAALIEKDKTWKQHVDEMWEGIKDNPLEFSQMLLSEMARTLPFDIAATAGVNALLSTPKHIYRAAIGAKLMRTAREYRKALQAGDYALAQSMENTINTLRTTGKAGKLGMKMAEEAATRPGLKRKLGESVGDVIADVGTEFAYNRTEDPWQKTAAMAIPAAGLFAGAGATIRGASEAFGSDGRKMTKSQWRDLTDPKHGLLKSPQWINEHPQFSELIPMLQEAAKVQILEGMDVDIDPFTSRLEFKTAKEMKEKYGYNADKDQWYFIHGKLSDPTGTGKNFTQIDLSADARPSDFVEEVVHKAQTIIATDPKYATLKTKLDAWYNEAGEMAKNDPEGIPSGAERFGQIATAHLGYADKYSPNYLNYVIPPDLLAEFKTLIGDEFLQKGQVKKGMAAPAPKTVTTEETEKPSTVGPKTAQEATTTQGKPQEGTLPEWAPREPTPKEAPVEGLFEQEKGDVRLARQLMDDFQRTGKPVTKANWKAYWQERTGQTISREEAGAMLRGARERLGMVKEKIPEQAGRDIDKVLEAPVWLKEGQPMFSAKEARDAGMTLEEASARQESEKRFRAAVVSTKPGSARGYRLPPNTTMGELIDYHDEVIRKVAPKGSIKLLEEAGIPNKVEHGVGTWEGVEPNITIRLPESKSMEEASHVAALTGLMMNQDAVITMKPVQEVNKKTGMPGIWMKRRDGNRITIPQLEELANKINPSRDPGGLQFSSQFNDITMLDPKFFELGEAYNYHNTADFLQKVQKAIGKSEDWDYGIYAQEGDYIGHEGYRESIERSGYANATEGSPSILKRAIADIYRPTREAFKKHKGWIAPEQDPALKSVAPLLKGTEFYSAKEARPKSELTTKERAAIVRRKHGPEFRKAAKHLTDEDVAKMNTKHVSDMMDVLEKLPPTKDFEVAAKRGEAVRGWYRRAQKAIGNLFGDDRVRFTGLLAATSPMKSVQMNLIQALRIWNDWHEAGKPTDHATIARIAEDNGILPATLNDITNALTEPDDAVRARLNGLKVDSFSGNFLGDLHRVTIDTWMMKFSGLLKKDVTVSEYRAMSIAVRRTAEKLGWTPAEVQETIWSFMYALAEKAKASKKRIAQIIGEVDDDYIVDNVAEFNKYLEDSRVRAELDKLGIEERIREVVGVETARDLAESRRQIADARREKAGTRSAIKRIAKRAEEAKSWQAIKDAEAEAAKAEKKAREEGTFDEMYAADPVLQKEVEDQWGLTKNVTRAGYITPDGKYIDLGSRDDKESVGRAYFHEDVFKKDPVNDKRVGGWKESEKFMNMGNIRLSPRMEPGMSLNIKPTDRQMFAISRYIDDIQNQNLIRGDFHLELIPDGEFSAEASQRYFNYPWESLRATRVIKDIENFFEGVETPESLVSKYHYSAKSAGEMRELSFPKTLRAAGRLAEVGEYEVKSNPETIKAASKIIADKGVDKAATWLATEQEPSAEQTEVARQLIDHHQKLAVEAEKKGDEAAVKEHYEAAVSVAADISEKLKNAGQMIQAASIVNKLTPEGVLIYAQKQVAKANEKRWFKRWTSERVVTAKEARTLSALANKMLKMKAFTDNPDIMATLTRLRDGAVITKQDMDALMVQTEALSKSGVGDIEARSKQLLKVLEAVKKLQGEVNVSKEILDGYSRAIVALSRELGRLSGEAGREAAADLQKNLALLTPVGNLRKVEVFQTIMQLLLPKTAVRNIGGNELFWHVENHATKYLATAIDYSRSKLTGKDRQITFHSGVKGRYWQDWMDATKAVWGGKEPGGLRTQLDLKGITFRDPRNPVHWFEKVLGVELRSFDYSAYKRAYNQTIGEMAYLRGLNEGLSHKEIMANLQKYIDESSPEIIKMADKYGKYVTFQDENVLQKMSVGIKDWLNFQQEFGFGSLINKYPSTPANLINRAVAYSPIGLVRSLYILSEPLLKGKKGDKIDVREAEMALSRAITGTLGFSMLGYYLASKGVLTGDYERDKDARMYREENTGERTFQFNLDALVRWARSGFKEAQLKKQDGDLLVTYDWAMPLSLSLASAAMVNQRLQEFKDEDAKGKLQVIKWALYGGIDAVANQPMLRGLQTLFGEMPGAEGGIGDNIIQILKGIPSSFVPAMSNMALQTIDNNRRVTYDPNPLMEAINMAVAKIPFWADSLPKMYTTLGQEKKRFRQGNDLWSVWFNPAFVDRYHVDEQMLMIMAPYDDGLLRRQFPQAVPRKLRATWRGEEKEYALTGQQIADLQKKSGEYTKEMLGKVLNDRTMANIRKLTPERQEELLAKIVRVGWERARTEFVRAQEEGKKVKPD